jgi:hypothetical protein
LVHLLFKDPSQLPLIDRPFFSSTLSIFFEKNFWAIIQLSSRILVGPALVLLPTSSTHTLLFGPFAILQSQSAASDCPPFFSSTLSLIFEKNFWAVIQLSSHLLVAPALVLLPTSHSICCSTIDPSELSHCFCVNMLSCNPPKLEEKPVLVLEMPLENVFEQHKKKMEGQVPLS